jgi:capsule polysaccharide modification protein KpsS
LTPGVFSNFGIIIPVELKVLGRVEALEGVITVVWVPHGTGMIGVGSTV